MGWSAPKGVRELHDAPTAKATTSSNVGMGLRGIAFSVSGWRKPRTTAAVGTRRPLKPRSLPPPSPDPVSFKSGSAPPTPATTANYPIA